MKVISSKPHLSTETRVNLCVRVGYIDRKTTHNTFTKLVYMRTALTAEQ